LVTTPVIDALEQIVMNPNVYLRIFLHKDVTIGPSQIPTMLANKPFCMSGLIRNSNDNPSYLDNFSESGDI
jgi:hypothetical protein